MWGGVWNISIVHYTFYTWQALLHYVKGFTKQVKLEGEVLAQEI